MEENPEIGVNTPVNYHSEHHVKSVNLIGIPDEELFGLDWLYEKSANLTEKINLGIPAK